VRRLAWTIVLGVSACRPHEADPPAPSESAPAAAVVPVEVAPVTRATLADVVSGPGRTAALVQEKVRPPFAGTLGELRVADGDHVRRGELLTTIVSRDTESALAGAREMAREAKTDAEAQAAARALALAERGLVRARIESPADGVVLSHGAAGGDRVTEDQEILTIEDASSLVFLVDVSQADVLRVRPGQSVSFDIGGRPSSWTGRVHDVLPAANPADFTAPVRIDLKGLSSLPPVGLFGTAHITVSEHRDVPTVPDAAVLRDDLTGKARIALMEKGYAHWLDVTTGLKGAGRTEIVSPPLAAGQSVIVSGQVGLPEGAAVVTHS
jgi:multidrug efflux pump subunit AcrA (membrane-fusion protein)